MKIYVPRDAAARALGADAVADAFAALGHAVIRNGSRGMVWLEPLVEIEENGLRRAYGQVAPGDVAGILSGRVDSLGPVEEMPFFARQTRLTFARCGRIDPLDLADYAAHGGLVGLKRALDLGPEGGEGGGRLVAEGTPEDIAAAAESHTGRFLAPLLREAAPAPVKKRKRA